MGKVFQLFPDAKKPEGDTPPAIPKSEKPEGGNT